MEIYKNSENRTVTLAVSQQPSTPSITATIHNSKDELLYTVPTVAYDTGVYSFDLPFFLVNSAQRLVVKWSFSYDVDSVSYDFNDTTYVDIVVPLVDVATARSELDIPSNVSDEDIRLTERRVRKVIEQFTGQVFAAYTASLRGTQLTDGSVRLPQKILTLTSVGGVANSLYYVLANGGWSLAISYPYKRDTMRAAGGEVPIVDPWATYRKPKVSYVWVTGLWGYHFVPTDIQEAALILIEQQLCPDSLYRERYIKTMTAADMRFEFDPRAYNGTGNVIADQILSSYRQGVAAVI